MRFRTGTISSVMGLFFLIVLFFPLQSIMISCPPFPLSLSHCAIMSLGTPASSSCQLWQGLTDWHAIKGPTHALAHAGNEFPQSLIKVTITLQP